MPKYSGESINDTLMWAAANVLALVSLLQWTPANARDVLSLFPSTRYLILSSPWRPTSNDECSALQQEFSAEVSGLTGQHQACLADTPADPNEGGSCSKASCQALHSAMDSASRKSSAETSLCRQRVGEYLAAQRQEAEQRRKTAEAAEREAKDREREDAARKAKTEADRQKDDKSRRDRDAERDRDRKAQEARDQRDRQEADARQTKDKAEREAARVKADKESADRASADKEARNQARAAQDAADQARRESERALAQARYEAELAHVRETAAKVERENKEQALYLDLVIKLKDGKDKVSMTKEFIENPFKKAAEMAGDAVVGKLVDKGLDLAAPIGPEKEDSRYEAVAAGVDAARGTALGGSPAADKISGAALEGINKINRQVLGQLDDLGKQMDQIGKGETRSAGTTPSTYSPSPPPRTSGGEVVRPRAAAETPNPFRRETNNDRVAAASPEGMPTVNPFVKRGGGSTYDDPDTGRTYSIPSGHILYRNPGTGALSVVEDAQVRRSSDDDWMEDGQPRCSASGKGRVLAECEKRRKTKNPFATK